MKRDWTGIWIVAITLGLFSVAFIGIAIEVLKFLVRAQRVLS